MHKDAVLVLDCGATNVRAIAVSSDGELIAKHAISNVTHPAMENNSWHIWDVDEILRKFARCTQAILPNITGVNLLGITVTTFGVDGALCDRHGDLLYPVISWKCPRTAACMQAIRRYLDPDQLQQISGVGHFAFNTLYKLIWLKENRPELLAKADHWLFISSLINHRLTGKFSSDRTMVGTSQLLDLEQAQLSDTILGAIGLSSDLFPEMVNAGEIIGPLRADAARELGLPSGIAVISSGHDTQFALFGSGAHLNQPILSSGTWEILMVRSRHIDTMRLSQFQGSTCELDAIPTLYNPGLQWLASGVVEWVQKLCWPEMGEHPDYAAIIHESRAIAANCDGVRVDPRLLVQANGSGLGAFSGLSLNTKRGHLYRATLEAMAFTLKEQLGQLEQIGQFKTNELLIVGGGSKNQFWNQIKTDVLDLPIKVIDEAETTVLGAAMFALTGVGCFDQIETARQNIRPSYQYHYPSAESEHYSTMKGIYA